MGKEVLVFDGGMGTLLQEKGLKGGEIPELWNIEKPDVITDIHRSYVQSGCDIITTNTFGANSLKLADTTYSVKEVVNAAIDCAKSAAGDKAFVALDLGPTGKLLKPYGDLAFDDAYNLYAQMIKSAEDRTDLILIETMSDTYEMKAALLAAKENSQLPVVVTFSFDESAKLLTGGSIASAVCLAESLGAQAVGVNCGLGPKQIMEFIQELIEYANIPICINPNAGLPVTIDEKTSYDINADEFSVYAEKFAQMGASILGGCCGTTPEHISKVAKRVSHKKINQKAPTYKTVVSSYSKTVELGNRPIIIGERINPTGKPLLKKALQSGDFEYICKEAISQTQAGADILDVNVGLPDIDEVASMEKAITMLQGITDTPLQIDTSNTKAMERALRLYNGRPLINSVNGKKESLDAVLPLVKKYGACVVALTLDERGIPKTVNERIEIAQNIIKACEEYGIDKSALVFDTLAMTISTGADNAKISLEALSYIRNTLGCNTVLGVSNISFGLPNRDFVNSAFFTMAMQSGLSAGIINPLSEDMMRSYRSYCALMGYDKGCTDYITAYTDTQAQKTTNTSTTETLHSAILNGLLEQSERLTNELLTKMQPLDIINSELIPALDEVGKGFEAKTLFLPQLLMSADAAKASFEAIKKNMLSKGIEQEKKGTIILATVKGDVHDIGKNIVKVLLENYGFDIIDLGKDVAPEVVVDTAVKNNIKLVGLSALMTTTVVNMEQTIKQLREKTDCKIMVGGAVLNQEYADAIGADFYSKDAMGSVRYAEKLFS